ncbi:CD276 antigen-like isoform X2 [Protopterus annectens]|uniref:CD276 antigen-like isoform X2 n=1 Tax=Protopterus annectens TaxID=7888 RepID=UPI001CF97AFC|nr:CD276 antigen-like isoform X2 [Protopterus annectens]
MEAPPPVILDFLLKLSRMYVLYCCFLSWYFLLSVNYAVRLEITPSHVIAGRNVTVNCEFEQSYDSSNDDIMWEFHKNTKRLIVWRSIPGTNMLRDQNEHFHGRTEVKFTSEKAVLTLRSINLSDSGEYRCIIFIRRGRNSEYLTSNFSYLSVAAPYSIPVVTGLNKTEEISLHCISYGGYPEGQLMWHYRNGSILTESVSTQHISNGMGAFVINSTLSLRIQQSDDICCSVSHTDLLQSWTTCQALTACHGNYPHCILFDMFISIVSGLAFLIILLFITIIIITIRLY